MNTTLPTMKVVALLSRLAALALATAGLAILFDVHAGVASAVAASIFLLLIAARDYAPRRRLWQPRLAPAHRPHGLRLAA